jgi:hypothetical protein
MRTRRMATLKSSGFFVRNESPAAESQRDSATPAQGCEERATLGETAPTETTPTGLRPPPHSEFLAQAVREIERRRAVLVLESP